LTDVNAPEPQMTALLQVIYMAILEARAVAALAAGKDPQTQEEALKRVVSLMNVTHNIPQRLTRFEKWDDALFRKFLKLHDDRWSSSSNIKLLGVYEGSLKNPPQHSS